uniref:Uncharacterized protein n=1 Tax=Plectus sambesii TaxID=2011161 RepID=A0A914WMF1_9BILA
MASSSSAKAKTDYDENEIIALKTFDEEPPIMDLGAEEQKRKQKIIIFFALGIFGLTFLLAIIAFTVTCILGRCI